MDTKIIIDPTDKFHLTNVRNEITDKKQLSQSLILLGRTIGRIIFNNFFVTDSVVTTPMSESYHGLISLEKSILIISTDADKDNYAQGIAENFKNCYKGYIDYKGKRGQDALKEEFRTMHLPSVPKDVIDVLVVAKTVLATGCTAISMTNVAIKKYKPKIVIIASLFYTQTGIQELKTEFPHVEFLLGEEDQLNPNGMLTPGIGNLDERLTA